MASRKAARPSGAGAGDETGQRLDSTNLPPCWCGAPGKARVEGRVLNGLAIIAVPVASQR